jgi:molybdopterin-containing oxidoreductase family iron-sulfur binding subunit
VGDGKHRQLPLLGEATPRARYWQSLAELTGAPPFAEGEFPEGADLPPNVSRRDWMKLLAAGMALAGLSGCTRKRGEKILPYTRNPENLTPGIPRHYATSLSLDGFATGVLVESHEGRPTKVEGNPDHPASLGATTAYEQAAVLGLYDPDRARALRVPSGAPSWERFVARFAGPRADRGDKLRFLLEPTGSPLVGDLVSALVTRFPGARFTFWSPTDTGARAAGARLAFGADAQPIYDYLHADVVVSLDDDFLATGPYSSACSRAWAERRRPSSPDKVMSRLYVVETMLTPTGSVADHRVRRRPSEIPLFAARLAAEIALGEGAAKRTIPAGVAAALAPYRAPDRDLVAIARDLDRAAGRSVITAGPRQPPIVHALAHLMNAMLGNRATATTVDPTLVRAPGAEQDLPTLAGEMAAGGVDTLVILDANPVYTAPRDIEFAARLSRVADVLHLGAYEDETAAYARWFVPLAHPFESWGDATAYDGTTSLVQPLIEPLFGGRTVAELLALFAGRDFPRSLALLRESWARRIPAADFDARFQQALSKGLFAGSAAPRRDRDITPAPLLAELARMSREPAPAGAIEASFAPDPSIHDGRFANNPWLLELPKPLTKITWENAALISPATAARLGLATEDVVALEHAGNKVRAPVFVMPGHADDAVTLHLGWGRRGALSVGRGFGFDAYALRTTTTLGFAPSLAIRKLVGQKHALAQTQGHFRTEGRPIALSATLAEYRKDPEFTAEQRGEQPTLMPRDEWKGDQWAMTIDTSICTGCSACVVACQAENNILVVGKDQVERGREMHWLRIDTYYHGSPEAPGVVHEPMLCQHCEKAPCEYVCPVNATVHSPDGTRFCSNNCPYKVRRFNWFDWNDRPSFNDGLVQIQRNPDVTVRQRGVMEKCSFCVQRIRGAEIRSRVENRAIRPGEVVTACAQACPTQAITFGSLAHEDTEMVRRREEPRAYEVLHELGTRPRVVYLARIDNPNPELE